MLKLLVNNEPELHTNCSLIETESDWANLSQWYDEMVQIALDNNLVGLSAPQVGITKRFFIVNVNAGEDLEPEFILFVNPKVKALQRFGSAWGWESCGSIKGWSFLVERWKRVEVSAQRHNGEFIDPIEVDGYLAIIMQHENQHLSGKLISDKFRQRKRIQ